MLFNSLQFAIFLPIVFILYWALPHKYRWILLWIASYYFYMSWNAKYVFLIFGTTLVSYIAGRLLENQESVKKKNLIVFVAALVSMGALFFFKYFNFFFDTVGLVLSKFAIEMNPITVKVVLPVGISFYTFQTLAYVVDVYRGKVKAEHHFGYYATFISFFPQLVAGPIERTSNLLPQIKSEKKFDYDKATYGMKLMAWGFFKKLCIADVIGVYVDEIFKSLGSYSGFVFALIGLIFAVQIYCDFSGYSDIAIGCAKLMGIDLMTNFKSPFFTNTINDFWRNWHISLSTWFKDYIYIPLGGSRKGKFRHCLNILITFAFSGLWHGANLTYVLWGTLHGLVQVIENIFPFFMKKSKGVVFWLRVIWINGIVSYPMWLIFRSSKISDAFFAIRASVAGITHPRSYILNGFRNLGIGLFDAIPIVFCLILLFVYDYASMKLDVIDYVSSKSKPVRYLVYVILLTLIVCFRHAGEAAFVYFQF